MTKVDYENWWVNYQDINRLDPGTRIRKKIICDAIKESKFKRILDLGCGSGELLEEIKKKYPNKELFGADISTNAISILQKKRITKKTFICDLEHDKNLPGNYDVIILTEVIEHIKNWKNCFTILPNIVNKKTRIVITTQSGKRYPHHKKIGHIKHFQLKDIESELIKNGFKIILAKKIGWPFMNLKNILVTLFLKDDDYAVGNISILKKVALEIFYYLYHISFFNIGPQIVIIAEKI